MVFQSVAAVRVIGISDMRIVVDGYSGMIHDALIVTWNVLVCLYWMFMNVCVSLSFSYTSMFVTSP